MDARRGSLKDQSAWEVAMDSDAWETLPFDIPGIECFPKEPMISSSEVS
jgi:hypothetical protein